MRILLLFVCIFLNLFCINADVNLTIDATPLFATNPLLRSCHLDEGYVHASWSLYSQMIIGASFDSQNIWNVCKDNSNSKFSYKIDPTNQYYNFSTMQIMFTNNDNNNGFAGLTNRGMGNEGLVFTQNQQYEGYIIVSTTNAGSLQVGLRDTASNYTLDSTTLMITPNGSWQNISFTLTPNASTNCIGITPGSVHNIDCGDTWPSAGHICVQCNGEFYFGLDNTGTVNVAYVYLQPGSWGRFAGLPVKAEGVRNLQSMDFRAVRVGGTYAQGIYWKNWTGNVAQRNSRNFFAGEGNLVTFGMFEMLDLGMAMDIEMIITMSRNHSIQDMMDLVDYCYGNESTIYGYKRIVQDNHPGIYRLTGIELGNEDSNDNFVDQIIAMEQRAKEINLIPSPFYYLYPQNSLPYDDIVRLNASNFPAEKVMGDCHGGWGLQLDSIIEDFHVAGSYNISGINCETNGLYNNFGRALEEAVDIITFDNAPEDVYSRIIARMVSFCSERSGHYTKYDQGASFWLPNMTWLMPVGWIHAMNKDQTGKSVVNVEPPSPSPLDTLDVNSEPPFPSIVSYSTSMSPGVVYLHIVNTLNVSTNVNVAINNMNVNQASGSILTLGSNSTLNFNITNSPAAPLAISPIPLEISNAASFTLTPFSYAVVNFTES